MVSTYQHHITFYTTHGFTSLHPVGSLRFFRLFLWRVREEFQIRIMAQGKVKWFNVEKGFGFIEPNDGGKDVFVHRNNVDGLGWDDGLRDGEEVEFDVEQTPKGLAAMNVQRVG